MTDNKITKSAIEKIAFAAVFVFSLFIAQAVIKFRSVIRLSAPIELIKSGLAVAMPKGGAWQSDYKWKFDGDGFTITSNFLPGASTNRLYARCRYILAIGQTTDEQRLNEYASLINSEVVETGQTSIQGLVINWAKISNVKEQTASIPFEIIFGLCRLPEGRCLEIETLAAGDETDLAQKIFNAIIKNIKFNDNGLLKTGINIVNNCRNNGLLMFLKNKEKQLSIFILNDASGQPVGFTMDSFTAESDSENDIEAASYFFRRGNISEEEITVLSSNDTFTEYSWTVNNRTRTRVRQHVMSVTEQNLLIQGADDEKEYTLSRAAVPEIIAEPVFKTFIDSNDNSMLIDLILSDGAISPLYAEKIEKPENGSRVIRIELLNGRGFSQKIYYDGSKNQIKTIFESGGSLVPSTAEEIAKLFPERAKFILNRNHLLQRQEL